MGFFSRLEKLSEKYIEGFFKTRFAEHVQPAEIAKLLLREMRDNKSVSVSKTYAPNTYTVYLGQKDWETIESVRGSLSREMQDYLKEKAFDKGYELVGEIKVAFVPDENLPLGKITVKSAYSEELPSSGDSVDAPGGNGDPAIDEGVLGDENRPVSRKTEQTIVADKERFYRARPDRVSEDTLTGARMDGMAPRAVLVQKIGARDGVSFPIGTRGIIIGRRRTNDVALEDSNVSRVHASLEYIGGEYFVTDLGSTNGTFVNGSRISRRRLSQGDQIRVGSTILEFRVV